MNKSQISNHKYQTNYKYQILNSKRFGILFIGSPRPFHSDESERAPRSGI
ncbi:hypothetical protein KAW65_05800 [candidate division WOR-3 bacterium]|nr:hypothetical protein [candidate division WOR-3 bacterium]